MGIILLRMALLAVHQGMKSSWSTNKGSTDFISQWSQQTTLTLTPWNWSFLEATVLFSRETSQHFHLFLFLCSWMESIPLEKTLQIMVASDKHTRWEMSVFLCLHSSDWCCWNIFIKMLFGKVRVCRQTKVRPQIGIVFAQSLMIGTAVLSRIVHF